ARLLRRHEERPRRGRSGRQLRGVEEEVLPPHVLAEEVGIEAYLLEVLGACSQLVAHASRLLPDGTLYDRRIIAPSTSAVKKRRWRRQTAPDPSPGRRSGALRGRGRSPPPRPRPHECRRRTGRRTRSGGCAADGR